MSCVTFCNAANFGFFPYFSTVHLPYPLNQPLSSFEKEKIFGLHQVIATELQQQASHPQKRRRRRRRNHTKVCSSSSSSNPIHCPTKPSSIDDDSSTCATVSSESSLSDIITTRPKTSQPNRISKIKTIQKHQQQRPQQQQCRRSPPDNDDIDDENDHHVPLEEQAKYVALDCEMVGVGSGGRWSSVARVTMVAWDGSIVLDEMVRPDQEVTDYRTFVSGITAHDLETATCTIEDVRSMVQDILQNQNDGHNHNNSNYKVLVGHALKNDLRALGITYPWYNIRDTAKYEPFMQVRFDDGVLWPKKLSELVKTRLHRDIQPPGRPHSSYEDAMAAMDLYKLVRRKWEKVMQYKINKTKEIETMQTTSTTYEKDPW
jgi:RNA exonuclease 4